MDDATIEMLKGLVGGAGGTVTFFGIVYGVVKAYFAFRLARPRADAEADAIAAETNRRDDEYRSNQFVALIDRLQEQVRTVSTEVHRLQTETHQLHIELSHKESRVEQERQTRKLLESQLAQAKAEIAALKGGGSVKA